MRRSCGWFIRVGERRVRMNQSYVAHVGIKGVCSQPRSCSMGSSAGGLPQGVANTVTCALYAILTMVLTVQVLLQPPWCGRVVNVVLCEIVESGVLCAMQHTLCIYVWNHRTRTTNRK